MVFDGGYASMTTEEANTSESSAWQRLLRHRLLLAGFPRQWNKQEIEEQGVSIWLHKLQTYPGGRWYQELF